MSPDNADRLNKRKLKILKKALKSEAEARNKAECDLEKALKKISFFESTQMS